MMSEPTNTSAILQGNNFKVLASTASVSVAAEDVIKDVMVSKVEEVNNEDVVPEAEEVRNEDTVPEEQAPPEQTPGQAKDIDMMESQMKKASSITDSTSIISHSLTRESILSHSLTRDKNDTRTKPFVVAVAMTAALGGLIFGYDIGGAGECPRCNGCKMYAFCQ